MDGKHPGKIEELMIYPEDGRAAYSLLSFDGFPDIGNKRFAILWEALPVRPHEYVFALNISKESWKRQKDLIRIKGLRLIVSGFLACTVTVDTSLNGR